MFYFLVVFLYFRCPFMEWMDQLPAAEHQEKLFPLQKGQQGREELGMTYRVTDIVAR